MTLSSKTLEVIATYNLDACETDELEDFQLDAYCSPFTIADMLWKKDEDEAGFAVRLLGEYARHRIAARNSRERGNIVAAMECESKCDKIYKQLPNYAKW